MTFTLLRFVAAGLIVGLLVANKNVGYAFKVFFLLCVVIAGIYGGITVSPRITLVQSVPAALGLLFVWLGARRVTA